MTARLLALLLAAAPTRAYLEARVALARGDVAAAETALDALAPAERSELAWRIAHALAEPARIGISAARLCAAAPRERRACADAELYARPGPLPPTTAEGGGEAPLSRGAPFPLALAAIGDEETGAVLDTGASETVISAALAERLGLAVTRAAFPVGTAGGGVVEARLALLPRLELAGVVVRALRVLVLPLPDLDRIGISAIVSPQQAFPGLAVRLDLGARRVAIGPGHAPVAAGALVAPYLLAGFDLAVEARVGPGPAALLGVNTGMEPACALVDGDDAGPAVAIRGAGPPARPAAVRGREIHLAGGVLAPSGPCVRAALARTDPLALAGQLGNGLWSGGAVVVDNAARTIAIERGTR